MTTPLNGFQQGAMLYTQAFGSRPESVEVPFITNRAPTSADTGHGFFPVGKRWIDVVGGSEYVLTSFTVTVGLTTANWAALGSSGSAVFTSLTSNTTISSGTSITAGTTLTATLGDITATNGNIVRGTAGNKDVYSSVATTTAAGANSAGTVTLVAGEAVVSTTAVTANSIIRLYRQGVGATGAAALGIVTVLTRSAGVSFTIRAVQPADATAAQASDVSSIAWEIVN